MGQVIQFPQRKPARFFGLYTKDQLIAAQHMVRQRKAVYVPMRVLPESLRKDGFGAEAQGGVYVEGYAVAEYENLCLYLYDCESHL